MVVASEEGAVCLAQLILHRELPGWTFAFGARTVVRRSEEHIALARGDRTLDELSAALYALVELAKSGTHEDPPWEAVCPTCGRRFTRSKPVKGSRPFCGACGPTDGFLVWE